MWFATLFSTCRMSTNADNDLNWWKWYRYILLYQTSKDNSWVRAEQPSSYLQKYLCWKQSSTNNLDPRKSKIILFIAFSCRLPIGWRNQTEVVFRSLFIQFQFLVKQPSFLTQMKFFIDLSFLPRFSWSLCEELDWTRKLLIKPFGLLPNQFKPPNRSRNER